MTADELAAKYGVADAPAAPATSSADALAAKYGVADQELPDEEPSTPSRQFNNTGPIEDIRAQTAADKAAVKQHFDEQLRTGGKAHVLGAAQGATYGFGDELAAGVTTGISKVPGLRDFAQLLQPSDLSPANNPNIPYSQRRDELRKRNEAAKEEAPKEYLSGEVLGSTLAPVPGGALVEGATTGAKIVHAAKTGAKVGALAGLGNSKADTLTGAAIDTGLGAAGGAVVGGGAQTLGSAVKGVAKALNPGKEEAVKAASTWVAKDIEGEVRGASTHTARQQLAMDKDNVAKIVLRDKGLREAIDAATEQSVDHLQHANKVVDERLAEVGKRLSPHWGRADAAIADAPLTSGQVVGHIDSDAAALRATGRTSDAEEAKALEAISARLKTAKDWGANKQIPSPLSDDAKAAVAQLEKFKAAASPQGAAKLEAKIAEIKSSATSEGFDPNHVVPLEQLQKLWSDEAGIAYNSMGGIHGTPTFERKLDVASHLRDLRDQVLARAAEKDPEAIAAMRTDLAHYSALKRVEKVLSQRENRAISSGGGASVPAEVVRKIKEFKHAPLGFIGGEAMQGAVNVKKSIDTAAALRAIDGAKDPVLARRAWNALLETKGGKAGAKVTAAIAAGIPRNLAMQAARTITAQSQPQ